MGTGEVEEEEDIVKKGRTRIESEPPEEPNWRRLSHLRPVERERIQSQYTPTHHNFRLERDGQSGSALVRQDRNERWTYDLYGPSSHVTPSRTYASAEEARDAAAKAFARGVRRVSR